MKIGPYFSGSNAAAVSSGQEAWRAWGINGGKASHVGKSGETSVVSWLGRLMCESTRTWKQQLPVFGDPIVHATKAQPVGVDLKN